MEYNVVTSLNCLEETRMILGNNFSLLWYSHLPTAIISLIVGIFIFIKNRKSLASKILFFLCLTFAAWLILNLILWISNDSRIIVFFWILVDILDPIFFSLSFYFTYVFVKKDDMPLRMKLISGFMILPLIILILARLGVNEFNVPDCSGVEGAYFLNYIYFIELLFSFGIIFFLVKEYFRQKEPTEKKQILILGSGMIFFLLSFFIASYLSEYIVESGSVFGYRLEFYGNFGITIFLGLLAYLIVKFKAFNIKLIGTQALVVALVILIGSQFFFVRNNTNRILTGVTLALAVGFGWTLIRSVKNEIKKKEELEVANKEINERKEQLQLMSDKLAQANDQLRKLDNAKSEFISIASHQLRTPLTAIKGFVSLLLEGSYGHIAVGIKEVLNKVYLSNERLIELVEDLLNLSRIESGRMEYKFEKIKMPELIKEIYDTFVIRSKEKSLKLETVIPEGDFPEVTTDRNKIREVISNLVDNALKYTKKGWVKIKLIAADGKIQVAISDTGIGVPQEELPYLFSKFSRGKDINRLNTGGTGLGLHVGKRMIEALSGRIWVESAGANQGSTFFIEVPMEVTKEA